MKVYNFGSDYAYQQELKQKQKTCDAGIPTTKNTEDVTDQVQTRREREADPAPETEENTKSKYKKKKENRKEAEEDCQEVSQIL